MGVLKGMKVIELAGLGPCPHAAMLLADMGASVLRIDRTANVGKSQMLEDRYVTVTRNRPSVALDLRHPEGLEAMLDLCDRADILIEGYRPGVIERLGLGPDILLARNPKLVIGRATGWGQQGPLAETAGHDINYIAITGALSCIGPVDGGPVPPLNLVGDYGGGSLYLALGVLAGYIHASKAGVGQVVDAAMIDGTASLMAGMMGRVAAEAWNEERRGSNFIDGGAHFYTIYETADGKYVSVGAIEPQFYRLLLEVIGIPEQDLHRQGDQAHWPASKEKIAAIFRTKTRAEWTELLQGTDACFSPVLTPSEAPGHPHNQARGTFIDVDGFKQPAPAPRFSVTPSQVKHGATRVGQHTRSALIDWGLSEEQVSTLQACGAAVQAN